MKKRKIDYNLLLLFILGAATITYAEESTSYTIGYSSLTLGQETIISSLFDGKITSGPVQAVYTQPAQTLIEDYYVRTQSSGGGGGGGSSRRLVIGEEPDYIQEYRDITKNSIVEFSINEKEISNIKVQLCKRKSFFSLSVRLLPFLENQLNAFELKESGLQKRDICKIVISIYIDQSTMNKRSIDKGSIRLIHKGKSYPMILNEQKGKISFYEVQVEEMGVYTIEYDKERKSIETIPAEEKENSNIEKNRKENKTSDIENIEDSKDKKSKYVLVLLVPIVVLGIIILKSYNRARKRSIMIKLLRRVKKLISEKEYNKAEILYEKMMTLYAKLNKEEKKRYYHKCMQIHNQIKEYQEYEDYYSHE